VNRAALAAALLFVSAGVLVGPAWATPMDEVTDLAERAIDDPSAREELAGITEIDGVPVDLGPLLVGEEEDIQGRLETLALAGTGQVDVSGAAEDAREILSDDRFKDVAVTGGNSSGGRATEWLSDRIPNPIKVILGSWLFWVTAGGVIVAISLLRTQWSRRLRRSGAETPDGPREVRPETPKAFNRLADQAEKEGDYTSAVRLRFKGGLAGLRVAGRIEDDLTTSAGRLRRAVPIPAIERLASTFEWIVYGDRPATPADAQDSRRDWGYVLEATGGRDA